MPGHDRAPFWLERLVALCLRTDEGDCRLGDLSERYVQTYQRVCSWLGATAASPALARLAADILYVGDTANVVLFARAIEPGQRLTETGTAALIAFDIRERTMTMLRVVLRKLVLPALLLVGSALVLNSAIDAWSSWKQTESFMARLQREKAEAAAQRIASFLSEIQRQLGWVSAAQWAALPLEQRRFDYVRMLRQVPAIMSMTQLDHEGREQLNVSRLGMDVVGSNVDRSADPAFVETRTNGVYFGPLVFKKQSEPYIIVSVGSRGGATVAELNLKLVWDVVQSIKAGDSGFAYVVDSRRHLVAHPDIAFVLRQRDLGDIPQIAAALANSSSETPFEGRIVSPESRWEPVLSVHAAVPQVGWLVFVDVPTAELREPFWGAVIRTGGLLALGLALAAAAILIATRPITVGGFRPA